MPILKAPAQPHKPIREPGGTLVFADVDNFRPNLRPDEVLQVSSCLELAQTPMY